MNVHRDTSVCRSTSISRREDARSVTIKTFLDLLFASRAPEDSYVLFQQCKRHFHALQDFCAISKVYMALPLNALKVIIAWREHKVENPF
jgi:hypothetical protein